MSVQIHQRSGSNIDNLMDLIAQYKNEERQQIDQARQDCMISSKNYRIQQRTVNQLNKKYLPPQRPYGFITAHKKLEYFDPVVSNSYLHISKKQLPDYQRLSILSPDRAQKNLRMLHPPTLEKKTTRIRSQQNIIDYSDYAGSDKSKQYIPGQARLSSVTNLMNDS